VLPLFEKLDKLQAENTGLRDRNDELTVEVEALTAKLASLKTKKYIGYVDCSVNSKTCLSIPIRITEIGAVDVCMFFCGGRNVCRCCYWYWPPFYMPAILSICHLSLEIFQVVPKHHAIKMCRVAWK
jgi:hypothetical protein